MKTKVEEVDKYIETVEKFHSGFWKKVIVMIVIVTVFLAMIEILYSEILAFCVCFIALIPMTICTWKWSSPLYKKGGIADKNEEIVENQLSLLYERITEKHRREFREREVEK